MARQSARGQGNLENYAVFSFDRGLDVKTSPLKRAVLARQDALVKAKNGVLSTAGAVSKRLDAALKTVTMLGAINTVPHVLTGGLGAFTALSDTRFLATRGFVPTGHEAAITGGIEFVKSDGTRQVIFGATDGIVYKLNPDGTTTAIDTGHTTGTKWYFEQYNDKLIICNRADVPRKWDGATMSNLGGSPPAKGGPVRAHGNRIFFLDGTNKSRLTWSALDNEEDYTTTNNAGSVVLGNNDGSDLVDLVPSINELVLLKGSRPYRLQGTSPATFTITNVVPSTGSVGAVASRAAAFALNDVWYLSSPGVVRLTAVLGFGDLRASFPSSSIQPYFDPNTEFSLSLLHLDEAVMVYDAQSNRLYIGVDSDGDAKNDTMLVYDLTTQGWTTWEGLSIASLWPVRNALTGQTDIYMGGYDGRIRALNQATHTEAVDFEVRHLTALGAPGVEKSLRHVFLYFRQEGNVTVTVDFKFDFESNPSQTFTVSLLGGAKTLGVNWVLGVDPLGLRSQVVKRLDVHGGGEFVEIGVRNTEAGQPVTWYGYEALYRVKRLVRRGTQVA